MINLSLLMSQALEKLNGKENAAKSNLSSITGVLRWLKCQASQLKIQMLLYPTMMETSALKYMIQNPKLIGILSICLIGLVCLNVICRHGIIA